MDRFLSPAQAASMVGISKRSLRWWIRRGQGPDFRLTPGGRYLLREKDVLSWFEGWRRAVEEKAPEMDKLLSLTKAARMLGISRWSLRWWVRRGQGPDFRLTPGGHHVFLEKDVLRWFEGWRGTAEEKATKRDELLTLTEVARMLGISRSSLDSWVRKGQGPDFERTPGGRYLFRKKDVLRWFEGWRGSADHTETETFRIDSEAPAMGEGAQHSVPPSSARATGRYATEGRHAGKPGEPLDLPRLPASSRQGNEVCPVLR